MIRVANTVKVTRRIQLSFISHMPHQCLPKLHFVLILYQDDCALPIGSACLRIVPGIECLTWTRGFTICGLCCLSQRAAWPGSRQSFLFPAIGSSLASPRYSLGCCRPLKPVAYAGRVCLSC